MRVERRGTSRAKRSSSRLSGTERAHKQMVLRVDQLLAHVDERELLAVGEHGFDGVGVTGCMAELSLPLVTAQAVTRESILIRTMHGCAGQARA